MNAEELDKMLGKKINGWAQESTDRYYVLLQLTYGKIAILSSESPIQIEVETEQ